MAIVNRGRVLRILQGQELQFHVSRDICCEYSLLNPAYRQAQRALIEILNHTRAFYERTRSASNDEKELFEYGGNIILFAAPRGGGKTRMMLSFSHVLANPEPDKHFKCLGEDFVDNNEEYGKKTAKCSGCSECFPYADKNEQQWLRESNFILTEPIAPAALEKEQSILYVVLSRLYRYAEKLLKKNGGNTTITESQKNELRRIFHNCLSGINGLKNVVDFVPEDFSVLQDISDGLSLRYHFYRLITMILEIAVPNTKADHKYLVLQIDDADSKIDGVYEVFEDIRKYLLVPNLVILMSADLDFLHRTITEGHLKRFEALQKFDIEYAHKYSGELSRVARKYIDKLIPPSHQVNLPELGRMSGPEAKDIKLNYLPKDASHKSHIENDSDFNLEITILMLIHRKTGVLFISPSSYLHNIIPRTQRGLNQLLFILNEMEDIPKVKHFNPKTDKEKNDNFTDDVLAQVNIAQRNLARFSEYFINDWVKVKIKESADRDFLNKFSSISNSELTHMTLAYLRKKYPGVKFPDHFHARMDRFTLEQAIMLAEESYRTPEDFLFYFAMRTLLTLNSHRLILREKEKIVQIKHDNKAIVFCFDEQNAFLTNHLNFNYKARLIEAPNIQTLYGEYNPLLSNETFDNNKITQVLFSNVSGMRIFGSYLNVFFVLLQLKKTFPKFSYSIEYQEILYQMQEYALMIVANWDVYGKIYRDTADIFRKTLDSYNFSNQSSDQPLAEASTQIKLSYLLKTVENWIKQYNKGKIANIILVDGFYDKLNCFEAENELNEIDGKESSSKTTLLSEIESCLALAKKDASQKGKGNEAEQFADAQDKNNSPKEVNVTVNIDEKQMENAIYKFADALGTILNSKNQVSQEKNKQANSLNWNSYLFNSLYQKVDQKQKATIDKYISSLLESTESCTTNDELVSSFEENEQTSGLNNNEINKLDKKS